MSKLYVVNWHPVTTGLLTYDLYSHQPFIHIALMGSRASFIDSFRKGV